MASLALREFDTPKRDSRLIDLIIYLALTSGIFFWLTRKIRAALLAALLAIISAIALALCLFALYRSPPRYDYVVWPSIAASEGLQAHGKVTAIDGVPVDNLGDFFARALNSEKISIQAQKEFQRHLDLVKEPFWVPLDSYDLEEASGGLAMLPRKPIYHKTDPNLRWQIGVAGMQPLRIISAHGAETPSIAELVSELKPVPPGGFIGLRMMKPSPDNGVQTVVYSPFAFGTPEGKTGFTADILAQYQLGLSGLTLLEHVSGKAVSVSTIYSLPGRQITGPAAMAKAAQDSENYRYFAPKGHMIAFPRLALLPRIFTSPLESWALGVPGTYLRQLADFSNVAELFTFWEYIPAQLYLLDDGINYSTILFRLSSLAASAAMALLALAAVGRFQNVFALLAKWRFPFLLLLTLLLQVADLFRFRAF
jgi:hypothetical protein